VLGRLAIALVVGLTVGFLFGHQFGTSASKSDTIRAQQDQMRAADLASRKEAERLAVEAARTELSVQLEDAANAQEPAAACLPVSRVLRLNQR
jgi:hypothetical protein